MSNIKRERLGTPRRIIKREYLDIRSDPQWKDAVERMDRSMEIHGRREIRKARDKIRNHQAQIERLENEIENWERNLRDDPTTPPRSRREQAERNGWIAPTKGPIKPAKLRNSSGCSAISESPNAVAKPWIETGASA